MMSLTKSLQGEPLSLSRRGLLRASVLGASLPVAGWLSVAHATALFPLDTHALYALANKVTAVLPAKVCKDACITMSKHLEGISSTSNTEGIESLLQLLHRDDIAHGRAWDVHGIAFSLTQIGVLFAMKARGAHEVR